METFVRLSAYTGRNLPVVQAVQGDTNRVITVEIKEFESLEGTTCRLVAMRPLGTDAKIDGTIDGGRVSFDLTDAITQNGDIYAQVQVTEGNNRVSTFDFVLQVAESREAMATAKEIYWVEDFIGKEGQKVDELIQTKGAAFDEMQNQKETAFDQFASAASDRFEEFMEGADQAVDNLIDTTTGRVNSFLESAEERVSEAVQTIPDLVDNKFAEKLAEIDGKVSEASGYASAAETAKESAESAKTEAESASEASQASANAAEVSASEAANSASQAASAVESAIVPLQQRIDKVESVNHRQQIEIDMNTAYRKKDKASIVVTDDAIAYSKDVPEGTLEWGEVKMVGGMSRRGYNLIHFPYEAESFSINGITFTVLDDGRIKVEGTATGEAEFTFVRNSTDDKKPYARESTATLSATGLLSGIKIVANGAMTNGWASTELTNSLTKKTNPVTDTSKPLSYILLRVQSGTVTNTTVSVMYENGSTAHDYEPYTAELITANLEEIESEGRNLVDSLVKPTATPTTVFLENGTYNVCTNNPNEAVWYIQAKNSEGAIITSSALSASGFSLNGSGEWLYRGDIASFTFNVNIPCTLSIGCSAYGVNKLQISKGSSVLPYVPYRGVIGSKSFPSAIASQMHGINAEVFDKVELVPRVFENMKDIDLGTLTYGIQSGASNTFYASISDRAYSASVNALCADYAVVPYTQDIAGMSDKTIRLSNASATIFIKNSECSTVAEIKQALSGVILHYEAVSGGTDYEAVVMEKKCGVIALDALYWYRYAGTEHSIVANISNKFHSYASLNDSIYKSKNAYSLEDKSLFTNNGFSQIIITDYDYDVSEQSGIDSIKANLAGKTLLYELETTQILDVTEYFTDENYRFIEVEGGGSITFKQSGDYKLAIPSTVEYDVKVGE